MARLIILIVFVAQLTELRAQNQAFVEIVNEVFHDERVRDKLFVDYQSRQEQFKFSLASGRYCFVKWNDVLNTFLPDLHLVIDGSTRKTGMQFKTPFVSNQEDTVFVAVIQHAFEEGIDPYVVFDDIEIGTGNAQIVFHTTSRWASNIGRNDFISVKSKLKKKGKNWEIVKLIISSKGCCDRLWP